MYIRSDVEAAQHVQQIVPCQRSVAKQLPAALGRSLQRQHRQARVSNNRLTTLPQPASVQKALRSAMRRFVKNGRLSAQFVGHWNSTHPTLELTLPAARRFYRNFARTINATLTLQPKRVALTSLQASLRAQQPSSPSVLISPTSSRLVRVEPTSSAADDTVEDAAPRALLTTLQPRKRAKRSESFCKLCNWPQWLPWHHHGQPLSGSKGKDQHLVCEALLLGIA